MKSGGFHEIWLFSWNHVANHNENCSETTMKTIMKIAMKNYHILGLAFPLHSMKDQNKLIDLCFLSILVGFHWKLPIFICENCWFSWKPPIFICENCWFSWKLLIFICENCWFSWKPTKWGLGLSSSIGLSY